MKDDAVFLREVAGRMLRLAEKDQRDLIERLCLIPLDGENMLEMDYALAAVKLAQQTGQLGKLNAELVHVVPRTDKEIVADAYSESAMEMWIAPVQKYAPGIPWPIHVRAYEAYCKKWSPQVALIDLKGRGCRGGFGVEELDNLIPGWRDQVDYVKRVEARLKELYDIINGRDFVPRSNMIEIPHAKALLPWHEVAGWLKESGKPSRMTSALWESCPDEFETLAGAYLIALVRLGEMDAKS